MAPRLPNITAKAAIRAFTGAGFVIVGQKGSHVRLKNSDGIMLVIPNHPGAVKRPLLKAVIKQAGLSERQFRELL